MVITTKSIWVVILFVACTTLVKGAETPAEEASPTLEDEIQEVESSSAGWRAGVHYSILAPPISTNVPTTKIEVIEFFMYTSPLSRRVQPFVKSWLNSGRTDVEYRRQPAIVFPHARLQAKMYFTLESLGRVDLHDELFSWTFDSKHYGIYHSIMRPDEVQYAALNLAFAMMNGIERNAFIDVYTSDDINNKVIEAGIAAHRYHIRGTSTFVVAGRFSTSIQRITYGKHRILDEDFESLFKLIDYLVALERERRG